MKELKENDTQNQNSISSNESQSIHPDRPDSSKVVLPAPTCSTAVIPLHCSGNEDREIITQHTDTGVKNTQNTQNNQIIENNQNTQKCPQLVKSLSRPYIDPISPSKAQNASVHSNNHVSQSNSQNPQLNPQSNTLLQSNSKPISKPVPSLSERLSFFQELRHAYGVTALMLSGGGTFGTYHIGVILHLVRLGLLPRIISGSSVGSLVAAIVGVRTDEEIEELFGGDLYRTEGDGGGGDITRLNLRFFSDTSLLEMMKRLWNEGCLLTSDAMRQAVQDNVGDFTFQEAFERTHKVLNITVSSSGGGGECILLNHLTAPTVLIWSAVLASCSVPGVFPPGELLAKDLDGFTRPFFTNESVTWEDGSVQADLPSKRLAELFNTCFTIVIQLNPHVVPFINTLPTAAEAADKTIWGWVRSPLAKLIAFLFDEVTSFCLRLANYSPFPLPRYLSLLVHQSYQGNITIAPQYGLVDLKYFLKNVTTPRLQHCIDQGPSMLFPRVCEIALSTAIERVVYRCEEVLGSISMNNTVNVNVVNNVTDSGADLKNIGENRDITSIGGDGAGFNLYTENYNFPVSVYNHISNSSTLPVSFKTSTNLPPPYLSSPYQSTSVYSRPLSLKNVDTVDTIDNIDNIDTTDTLDTLPLSNTMGTVNTDTETGSKVKENVKGTTKGMPSYASLTSLQHGLDLDRQIRQLSMRIQPSLYSQSSNSAIPPHPHPKSHPHPHPHPHSHPHQSSEQITASPSLTRMNSETEREIIAKAEKAESLLSISSIRSLGGLQRAGSTLSSVISNTGLNSSVGASVSASIRGMHRSRSWWATAAETETIPSVSTPLNIDSFTEQHLPPYVADSSLPPYVSQSNTNTTKYPPDSSLPPYVSQSNINTDKYPPDESMPTYLDSPVDLTNLSHHQNEDSLTHSPKYTQSTENSGKKIPDQKSSEKISPESHSSQTEHSHLGTSSKDGSNDLKHDSDSDNSECTDSGKNYLAKKYSGKKYIAKKYMAKQYMGRGPSRDHQNYSDNNNSDSNPSSGTMFKTSSLDGAIQGPNESVEFQDKDILNMPSHQSGVIISSMLAPESNTHNQSSVSSGTSTTHVSDVKPPLLSTDLSNQPSQGLLDILRVTSYSSLSNLINTSNVQHLGNVNKASSSVIPHSTVSEITAGSTLPSHSHITNTIPSHSQEISAISSKTPISLEHPYIFNNPSSSSSHSVLSSNSTGLPLSHGLTSVASRAISAVDSFDSDNLDVGDLPHPSSLSLPFTIDSHSQSQPDINTDVKKRNKKS